MRSAGSPGLRRAIIDDLEVSAPAAEHFQEGAAVLEQTFTNRTGPDDPDGKADRLSAFADRQRHPQFLPEQAAGGNKANAGQREVPAQQRERTTVLGLDVNLLDEVDAVLSAALLSGCSLVVGADQPAHGTEQSTLLLVLPQTGDG